MEWKVYRVVKQVETVGGTQKYVRKSTKTDSFKINAANWGIIIRRMGLSSRLLHWVEKLAFGVVMTIFGSIYACEQVFSCIDIIKSKVRSQLANEN